MARWIIRSPESKEYFGTLTYTGGDEIAYERLFSDIDEICDPYDVEFTKEFSFKQDRDPIWLRFDPEAPYTGLSGVIIECKSE